jgi:hypothetical protein
VRVDLLKSVEQGIPLSPVHTKVARTRRPFSHCIHFIKVLLPDTINKWYRCRKRGGALLPSTGSNRGSPLRYRILCVQ